MFDSGSEWRRWDLHIHTPRTILNDQFGSWDEYLAAINNQTEVRVIGATDYLTIKGYSEIRKYKEAGRLPNIDLILPNIEFRIAPPTEKATAVNIHLLVSPDEPNHETEILNALGRLYWEFDNKRYSCVPDQLTALGYAFDRNIKADKEALAAGVSQFKVDFTTFHHWYRAEPWLRQNSIVAVSAGADGISGFRRDGAWVALRDEITRASRILFSGRPGEREFWLGMGSEEDKETMRRLNGPKPCVHGSDAHSIAKLFKPDQDRYCWIKADPTFEGLRQILYEPGERVFIGPSPPVFHDAARIITEVRLSGRTGWFDAVSIPLNSCLVSVIGQEGSGKSALAELIAYSAGSWSAEEPGSFLNRAGEHLEGLIVDLRWGDGTTTRGEFWKGFEGNNDVRYLSQNFVERLCAQDGIGTELVREIENVIFAYLDPIDTLNASDFDELRHLKTDAVRLEAARLSAEITAVIQEECVLRAGQSKLSEKRNRIKALGIEREGLIKQIPPANSPEEERVRASLQQARNDIAKLIQSVGVEKQKLQTIADIKTRVSSFDAQAARFYSELQPLLRSIGIAEGDAPIFRPIFGRSTNTPLDESAARINIDIMRLEGQEPPIEGTVRWLQQQIKALQERETADKARQERTKIIQTRVAVITAELERIEAEIRQIEGPDRERIEALKVERFVAYRRYFENLKVEQQALENLYEPIRKRLNEEALLEDNPLEFSIKWEVNIRNWLERGGNLFDQRKAIPYGTFDQLGDAARRVLVPAFTSGDPDRIAASLDEFMKEFRATSANTYMRSGVTFQDVLNWLFEIYHIKLTYGLKFNGTELENLSPGTKGIVLLILYLGMDIGDTRPLIVDQPDENLDNESIFNLLTPYFRRAKARRQIVVITHNPNLVVNSDSEQVIVARNDRRADGFPHITYQCGSLENNTLPDNMRQQVCRILEGGKDAFLKREQRYFLRY